MCEFCVSHGEGKKWYENAQNYSNELYYQITSKKQTISLLNTLQDTLLSDMRKAYNWKSRIPLLYNLIVYPFITYRFKKMHFGQVIPLEDGEKILDNSAFIMRLPCVCRKVTANEKKRYCIGLGFEVRDVADDIPDFSDYDVLSKEEAKEFIKKLDDEGNTHSVWTLKTPFIGGICNCDRDCMAYKSQIEMKVSRVMWKSEYIAAIDPDMCTGCRQCMDRCYFDAITYDRRNKKCSIDLTQCYGCGTCRAVCKKDAISLLDRQAVADAAHLW